jgi:UDP-N-acetylglucosamine acyltransferase
LAEVHPTAIVDRGAELAETATVGPYCIVSAGVRLADGVRLHSHAVVAGTTTVGAKSQIFPFASVGMPPQDRKYRGEASRLEIGRNCTIREHVTINPGTEAGGLVTRIGDDCLLLVGAHVAHDCTLGNSVTLVNYATLGGHCRIGDHVILGGLSAVHQFVRIGEHAFVGGMSGVENDIIPYGLAIGNRAELGGLNIVGLTRHGFPRESIHVLRRAYRTLFGPEGTLKERLADVEQEFSSDPHVRRIVDFIREGGDRALCTPRARSADL